MINPIVYNGQFTKDTPREKGWEEGQGQASLQCETCTSTRSTFSQTRKNRYIYIENTSEIIKPFLVEEVDTVQQLCEYIYELYPQLNSDVFGLRVSNVREGVIGRKYFTDSLPSDDEFLYISLYLKKHPPFNMNKIEKNK